MIVAVLSFVLAVSLHDTSAVEEKCRRDFRKVGCFVRDLKLIPHLLITDLDPTHKNFTTNVDWDDYAGSLHSLACRCRQKAKGHYKYFGIGMYGECSGGNDNTALENLFKNPNKSPLSCINGEHKNCDVDAVRECAGTADNDFFYEIIEGDCSVKIGKGDVFTAYPNQVKIEKGKLVTTFPKVGMVYEISLEVYPTSFQAGWASVFHMTVAGNYGVYGERIPGIWFTPSSTSATTNSLHICNAISSVVNHCYNSEKFPLNKWIKIRIMQSKYNDYEYSIFINDKKVVTTKNTRPVSFDNVKLYVGDPWHNPQRGYVRNLKIAENCYDQPINDASEKLSNPKETVLKQNTLIGQISHLCKEYQVSFDVKPTAYASGWHSVFHLTLGGNYRLYGDRTPGVWFHPSSTSAATNSLHICGPINRNRNKCFNSQQFPKGKWISVKVSQEMEGAEYFYRIHINGNQVYEIKNSQPLDCYDLKAYAADPWYPAQAGSIRNININGECKSPKFVGHMENLIINKTTLVKNTLIGTMTKLEKVYEISFEVYPTKFQSYWASVLHLTVAGNYGVYGDRIPGVWFSPSTPSATANTMHICNAINGERNYCYQTKAFPLNNWIRVRISQENVDSKYIYRIFIDDELAYKFINTRPVSFSNVKVYAGDPWHTPQAGFIRNLIIPESFMEKQPISNRKFLLKTETILRKNNLIGTLGKLCKEYTLSLEIKATSFGDGWRSVLHLSVGGNIKVYGDRNPGIWFKPSTKSATTNAFCLASPINRNSNSYHCSNPLPTNKWINVKVTQVMSRGDYYYSIDVDGKRVYMVKNTLPMIFYDLSIYAGDPWYEPLEGSIRNLNIDGGSC